MRIEINENGLYAVFWMCITTIVLGITFVTSNYWTDYNAKVAEMVAGGANPIAVTCAMQDDYGNNPTCVIIAEQSKKD